MTMNCGHQFTCYDAKYGQAKMVPFHPGKAATEHYDRDHEQCIWSKQSFSHYDQANP